MNGFPGYFFDLFIRFDGWSNKVGDNVIRFGLATLCVGVLLAIVWSRQRRNALPVCIELDSQLGHVTKTRLQAQEQNASLIHFDLGLDPIQRDARWRNEEQAVFQGVATAINRSLEQDRMLHAMLDQALNALNAGAGWIHLIDRDQNRMALVAQRGFSQENADAVQTVALGQGLASRVAQSREPLAVDDLANSPLRGIEPWQEKGLCAFSSVPIQASHEILGVLSTFSATPASRQEIQTLTSIGQRMGTHIQDTLRETEEPEQGERYLRLTPDGWRLHATWPREENEDSDICFQRMIEGDLASNVTHG